MAGVIPCLRNLVEYLLETSNVYLLGGSPLSTIPYMVSQIAFGSVSVAVTWTLAHYLASATLSPFIWTAATGVLLSMRGFDVSSSGKRPLDNFVDIAYSILRAVLAALLVSQLMTLMSTIVVGWMVVGCTGYQLLAYIMARPFFFSAIANPLNTFINYHFIPLSFTQQILPFLSQLIVANYTYYEFIRSTQWAGEADLWVWILLFRIMRRAWTNVVEIGIEVSVTFICSLYTTSTGWNGISFVTRCFIVGLVWSRVRILANQTWMVMGFWKHFLVCSLKLAI